MIVLDTDVLSALMRRPPEAALVAWLDRQPPESIWITAVTVFEIRYGLDRLPAGRRRAALAAAFDRLLADDLDDRVLPFDRAAAQAGGALAARRATAGRPVDTRDTQIAGIVLARRATLATRNVRHFEDLPSVVDPAAAPEPRRR